MGAAVVSAALTAQQLADIQGLILRSYKMPRIRGFVLRIGEAAAGRALLGRFAEGNAQLPSVRSAAPWETKPDFCLNVGLTFDGLRALNLPSESLASFPEEFAAGAVARAAEVGDTGANAPEHWIGGLNTGQAHLLVSLSAQSDAIVEDVSRALRALFAESETAELFAADAAMLPNLRAHFDYADGISQPKILGAPAYRPDSPQAVDFGDPMETSPLGAFVLGYESQHPGLTYPYPAPDTLGRNGSFAALRILKQDCAAFERYLDEQARALGLDRELIAAKLCGRWRSGVPLALSPDSSEPAGLSRDQWNRFDYSDDPQGARCPFGAHIRRNNPRATPVAGNGGQRHRIMRRGLPYGPPFDPDHPSDGMERGLLGLFICANLKDQFEFLMKHWVQDGDFIGIAEDRDPIAGNQPPEGGRFRFRDAAGKRIALRGMPSFVTTRGAAYCFLPSLTALRWIASLP
jgi:Dyp-type peroxidase family